jgi:hypothetical protein
VLRSRRRLASALLAVVPLTASCHDSRSPTEPAAPLAALELTHTTEHFTLRHSAASASVVMAYGDALEANRERILSDLGVASTPRTEGHLHPDSASFAAATGVQARGAVESANRFHIVALPFAADLAVHEFAHCVSMHLARAIPNNPTWLWESVAIYEAGQFVDPRGLSYLVAGQFPTFAQLNDRGGSYSIYEVGYTVAEAIVDRWGLDGLRQLVVALGDSSSAFGVPISEVERTWREFVSARYL